MFPCKESIMVLTTKGHSSP